MKAFIVFFAILLHCSIGVAIACPEGFRGPDCEEKCTKDCNQGMCVWRNETVVCLCDDSKWTGPNCEEVLPCANAKCNHGKCKPDNNTLIPFICECDAGYKGDQCDEAIIDLCTGSHNIPCENNSTCVDNKCVCLDGFGGEHCQNRVPKLSDYSKFGCNPKCASIFADDKCDEDCNTANCFYDGHDCTYQPTNEDDDSGVWIDMDQESRDCLMRYGNGVCDRDCNAPQYGFDGGDCDQDSRGEATSRIHITLGVNPTNLNLSHKFFLAYLAQTLRARISISKNKLDDKPEVYAKVNSTKLEERITLDDSLVDRYTNYTKLIVDVDASFCKNETCLQLNGTEWTIEPAIILLNTRFVQPKLPLAFPSRNGIVYFIVEDVRTPVDWSPSWIEIVLAVIISMLTTLLLALLIIACCLILRRRRYSKAVKDGGKRRGWVDHHKNRMVAAVEEGNVAALTALLADVTPIEAANAEDVAGNTVLHMAASRDDKAMVQLLLHSRMFDVCSVNSIGQSPLLYALRDGKPGLETLTLLVNAINDAKLHQRTTGGGVGARAAISHLMLTVLSEEPGWGLTDAVGRSALHHAALAGRPRHIIHFLVSHGASPGLQDTSGNTPLHLAAINGHSETVHALLDERAAVTVTNSLGNTPAQVCQLNGHLNLAAMLFEREQIVCGPSPIRSRHDSLHDSLRGAMYSTVESVFSDEPDELVLPSLLSFRDAGEMAPLLTPTNNESRDGADVCGCVPSTASGARLSVTGGFGSRSLAASTLSGSAEGLLGPTTTPTPKLPHILTPSSQLVEGSPERDGAEGDGKEWKSMSRKCLYGVERSPSDPRPSQLTTPYPTFGKRRSLPDGPSMTTNYRDVLLLSPVHFAYGTNTMSSTSQRSQASSNGHESLVSSFRPPPLS